MKKIKNTIEEINYFKNIKIYYVELYENIDIIKKIEISKFIINFDKKIILNF